MAVNSTGYTFFRSDGTTPVNIGKGIVDDTQFSVPMVGQNSSPYGDSIAQAQVHMLENFAHSVPPNYSVTGQWWCDTTGANPGGNTYPVMKFATLGKGDASPDPNLWAEVLSVRTRLNGNLGEDTTDGAFAQTIYAENFKAMGADGSGNGEFIGTATRAKYADLAERFHADDNYAVGTLLKIGGKYEVTATDESGDMDVLGIVSDQPAFMMNAEAGSDETHPYVAFAGRVPVRLIGSVKKGDRIVSSPITGVAKAVDKHELLEYNVYQVIGRALEDNSDVSEKLVMVVVGAN